jgi:hypothetical protein
MSSERISLATAHTALLRLTLLSVSRTSSLDRLIADAVTSLSSLADMLEAIGAGSSRQVGKTDWADLWLESPESEKVQRQIAELDAEGLCLEESTDPSLGNACKSSKLTAVARFRS